MIGLSPGKISHKSLLQQESVKLKKKGKSLFVQFKTDIYSWKKAEGVQVVSNSQEKEWNMKVLLAWKMLVWITPQPFLLQQVSQKVTSQKILKTVPFAFLTLRLQIYQMTAIVQVSAVDFDGLRLFDQYIYPNGSIRFGSTEVTGITKSSGKLFCHWKLVDAVEVNMSLNREKTLR